MMGSVVLGAGGSRRNGGMEQKFALQNEGSLHVLFARLQRSQVTIFDLQTKLVCQKTEAEGSLFQAFVERDREKQRADRLEKQLATEREKSGKLHERFRKTKEENSRLWQEVENATRQVQDLQEKVVASVKENEILLIQMKELQREVNAVRRLPVVEKRYGELQTEERKQKIKEIGTRVGYAFVGAVFPIAVTVAVTSFFGPVGLFGIAAVPPITIAGALAEVPKDPKEPERKVEMNKLRQEITYIRTGTA